MPQPTNFLEPLRFPGDDYAVRFTPGQLLKLCQLLCGLRQNNPDLFADPETVMMELQLAHQLYVHQMVTGDETQKASAGQKLDEIRRQMSVIIQAMRQ